MASKINKGFFQKTGYSIYVKNIVKKTKDKNFLQFFFIKDLKFSFSDVKKIAKVIKYCKKIKTPDILIDKRNALKNDIRIISRYLKSLSFEYLSKILIDTYVHINQKLKKGISFGLKRPCPNKYG